MRHRLIWFRDDLRVNDNAAVSAALNCDSDTRISAVFLTADDEWESSVMARIGYITPSNCSEA